MDAPTFAPKRLTRSARLLAITFAVTLLAPTIVTAQHTHQDGPAVVPTVVASNDPCPADTLAVHFSQAEIQDGVTGTNKHVNFVTGEAEDVPNDADYPHRTEIRLQTDPFPDENDPQPDPAEPTNGIRFDLDQPADGVYVAEVREVHVRAATANQYSYAAFAEGGTEHDDELTAPADAPYSNGAQVCVFVEVPNFTDIDGSIFEADILWLASVGVTGGCSVNPPKFCPGSNVTRAQMASFLVRALELPQTTNDHFTDDEGSIHEDDINALAEAGVTGGCGGTRYCPSSSVTRAQMASFLVRALDLAPSATDAFTDDDSSIHEADINALAASGITGGCGGTKFCPSNAISRGQMAAFLNRALND